MPGRAFRNSVVILALLFLVPTSYRTLKANCAQCAKNYADQIATRDRLQKVQIILRRNEEYIGHKPNAPASIVIKVRSNILMAKVQIETMNNQMMAYELDGKKLECKKCPTP